MCPRSLDQFLMVSFYGFGRRKETKFLWQCAIFATLWCILLERNSCIFKEDSLAQQLIWDKIRCLASIWCKTHGLFKGISLTDMLRDWAALLH